MTPPKKPTASKTKKTITAKKVAPKKTVAKKTVSKKAPVKSTSTCSIKGNQGSWKAVSLFLGAMLLGNILGGEFLGNNSLSSTNLSTSTKLKLSNDQELLVHKGKTWIPVEGNPVELIVLNDKTCGISCDPSQVLNSFRQGITPALLVRNVDAGSEEGKEIVQKFDIKGIPSFLFGDGIDTFERGGERFLDRAGALVTEKDGLYLVNSAATGGKFGKFLTAPDFDITEEPQKGSGPVTVVEFTDLQCPFCKRLHDQNKDLVAKLIAEDKITYVQKDFPLGFHIQAGPVHAVGNCVYQNDGSDTFFAYRDLVFDNQTEWSGNTDALSLAVGYAETVGATTNGLEACAQSPDTLAEIKADMEIGAQYGVSGTPALFIGSQVMPGAIGSAAFEAAVNAELAK